MSRLALHGQSYPSDFAEPHVWSAQDNREVAAFFAQVTCIVAAAVVLYAMGPAVGLMSVAGCLAVWALLWRPAGAANQRETADRAASAETSLTSGGGRRPDGDRSPRGDLDKRMWKPDVV